VNPTSIIQVTIMKIHLSMGASALALGACANAPAPLPDVTNISLQTGVVFVVW